MVEKTTIRYGKHNKPGELRREVKHQEMQIFDRLSDVKARDGMVVVLVNENAHLLSEQSRPSVSQVWTVREAAQRTRELNKMARKIKNIDLNTLLQVVEKMTNVCKEAQLQQANIEVRNRAMSRKAVMTGKEMEEFMKNSNFDNEMRRIRAARAGL